MRLLREVLVDDLERELFAEIAVANLVDAPHAAFADAPR